MTLTATAVAIAPAFAVLNSRVDDRAAHDTFQLRLITMCGSERRSAFLL